MIRRPIRSRSSPVTAEEPSKEPLIFFPARDMPGFVAEIRPIFADVPFSPGPDPAGPPGDCPRHGRCGHGFTVLPEWVSTFIPAAVRLTRIESQPTMLMCIALPERPLIPAAEFFRRALLAGADHARLQALR